VSGFGNSPIPRRLLPLFTAVMQRYGDDLEDDFVPDEAVALSGEEAEAYPVAEGSDTGELETTTSLSAAEEHVPSPSNRSMNEKKRKRKEKLKEKKTKVRPALDCPEEIQSHFHLIETETR
jgi:protein CMS1